MRMRTSIMRGISHLRLVQIRSRNSSSVQSASATMRSFLGSRPARSMRCRQWTIIRGKYTTFPFLLLCLFIMGISQTYENFATTSRKFLELPRRPEIGNTRIRKGYSSLIPYIPHSSILFRIIRDRKSTASGNQQAESDEHVKSL